MKALEKFAGKNAKEAIRTLAEKLANKGVFNATGTWGKAEKYIAAKSLAQQDGKNVSAILNTGKLKRSLVTILDSGRREAAKAKKALM